MPRLHPSLPLCLTKPGGATERTVDLLESWGLIHADDCASSWDEFARIGFSRLEQRTGSFDNLLDDVSLSFMPGGDGWRAPTFGLGVGDGALNVDIQPLMTRLYQHASGRGFDSLAAWFALNLHGPAVFGPYYYADIVRMWCWSGEEDEEAFFAMEGVKPEDRKDYNIYTKAEVIEDTAPWIFEQKYPEDHGRWLSELSLIDAALAGHMQAFIASRNEARESIASSDMDDVIYCDAVFYTWGANLRVVDVYDDYMRSYWENGICIDWAWLVEVEHADDLNALIPARAYTSSAAALANHILSNYP